MKTRTQCLGGLLLATLLGLAGAGCGEDDGVKDAAEGEGEGAEGEGEGAEGEGEGAEGEGEGVEGEGEGAEGEGEGAEGEGEGAEGEGEGEGRGVLRLVPLQQGKLGQLQQPLSVSNEFNLGTIRGSADFLFLLQNTGDAAITDLVLATSDPAFEVSPTAIASLAPAGQESLLPIVRVRVVHGTALEGIGATPLLTPGAHDTHLTITGTTGLETPEEVGIDAALQVEALVAEFRIETAAGPLDFAASPPADYPTYECGDRETVTIRNTGNVELGLRVIDTLGIGTPDALATLAVDAQVALPLPPLVDGRWGCILEVDPHNTVADTELYRRIDNNGKIYLRLIDQY